MLNRFRSLVLLNLQHTELDNNWQTLMLPTPHIYDYELLWNVISNPNLKCDIRVVTGRVTDTSVAYHVGSFTYAQLQGPPGLGYGDF